MTRTLNSPVANQRSEFCYLYELDYSSGTVFLTNNGFDISWGGNTYVALGGALVHEPINETQDRKSQGVRLQLFGVDQTIIATILNNDFRNRDARIYLVHFDPDTGVMGTPDLLWRGRQYGDYHGTEDRQYDGGGGRVTLECRIGSSLDSINIPNATRCNVSSHNEMLRRAGVSIATLDQFFSRVPSVQAVKIYWGSDAGGQGWNRGDAPAIGKAKPRPR